MTTFPDCNAVMIGRGLIRDPSLIERIREEILPVDTERQLCTAGEPEMHSRLWDYQLALYHAYHDTIESDRDVIAKMKELWSYMGDLFPGTEKNQKQIRKAWTYEQYLSAVSGIFSDHQDGEK
jgi:tRNA-dihydrouridine synthase